MQGMKALPFEEKLLAWIREHLDTLFLILMAILAAAIRFYGKDMLGGDMRDYFIPWHDTFSASGFSGLKEQVGDYNIPFQILVWIMTLIPMNAMYKYKLLACCFDYLMAFTGRHLIRKATGNKGLANGACIALLFLPEVVFNSAYLGQCDAMWTSFVLLGLAFLMKDKILPCFLCLGIAFSFKLQFVFILPVFVFAYVCGKRFSVFSFLLIPLTLMAMCIPAYIAGRPLADCFGMYFFQVYQYHDMSLGFPSFWTLIGLTEFNLFYKFAILFTVAVLGCLLYLSMKKDIDMHDPKMILTIAALTSWTCVLFLPDMHERYGYLADILLILLCFANRKYAPWAIVPAITSACVYFAHYQNMNMQVMALFYFLAYVVCIVFFIRSLKRKEEVHSA